MNYSGIIIVLLALTISTSNMAAQTDFLTKKNIKIIDAAIEKNFDRDQQLKRKQMELDEDYCVFEINSEAADDTHGWAFIASGLGRSDHFDFLVIFNQEKVLMHLEILQYRSSRGYQITSKGWLNKFQGLSNHIKIGDSVDAISGATLSSHGLVKSLNKIMEITAQF